MNINPVLVVDITSTILGPFKPSQMSGLEFILNQIQNDPYIEDPRWAAYMLATTWHETAFTMQPIDEYGSNAYFEKRYGYTTKVGRTLGNRKPNDGILFHGRGYVQLTGRNNYARVGDQLKVDLVSNPNLVKSPEIAYQVMSQGMIRGWFTGKQLSDYINGSKCDYVNSRRIINGTDKAQQIAKYAKIFEAPLL